MSVFDDLPDSWAMYADDFRMATVSVSGKSSVLIFDDAEADALKLCIECLKAKSPAIRLAFYRDLLGERPLGGPGGILAELTQS